jgi:glucose-1-phosphate adenylyltransferase
VYGRVEHSVLFAGVQVMEGASIVDSVVMPGAVVERGASVTRAIIAEDA